VKKEETSPEIHQVVKPELADGVLELLQNVVQNGTAAAAKSLGLPLGGKTGTTNDFTDAWFIGFNPSITAAVWVGFDEKKTLGNKESGAVVALPIWMDLMREILKGQPVEYFPTAASADQALAESSDSTPFVQKHLFIEDLPGSKPPSAGATPPQKP
jgi:penicillin-binding protein 1A